MSGIVEFPAREERHWSGHARCADCDYLWVAVVPLSADPLRLECPSCHTMRGYMVALNYGLLPAAPAAEEKGE